MTNQIFRNLSLLVLILPFISLNVFASDGTNGKMQATVNPDKATVGEATTLTVTVNGMTNGGTGKKNGSSKYTITIPDNILNADGTEVAEKNITNDLTEKGEAGNNTYNHGSYTTGIAGTYTFPLAVSTGDKEGSDPVVAFHPAAPSDFKSSNVTPWGFTLSWMAGKGAETYDIEIAHTGTTDTIRLTNLTGTSCTIDTLKSKTEYECNIRSAGGGLYSLASPDAVKLTTPSPALITVDGNVVPFADFILGVSPVQQQIITVNGTNLRQDISLALATPNSAYTTTPETIGNGSGGQSVTIAFNPPHAGTFNDTLTINSLWAKEIRIPLAGNAQLQTPVALPATDEEALAFTAHWEAVPFAEEYLLTVLDNTQTPVVGYEQLSVGNTTSYNVQDLLPVTKYTYSVIAVNNGVQSAPSNTISTTTLDGAVIIYSKLAPFAVTVNESDAKTIRISGNQLIDNITLTLSDDTHFHIDKTELAAEGGSVLVTYTPTSVDRHEATLTLSSPTAANVLITLQGSGLPTPTTAIAATGISNEAFTALWETKENADDYLLTVMQGDKTIVADSSSQGMTSLTVDGLAAGTTYTYTVKVVENGLSSMPSNAVTAITHSAPHPTAYPERNAIRVTWPAVPMADSYKVSLYAAGSETPMEQYNGIATTTTEYTFADLDFKTDYAFEVIALFGEKEYTSGKTSTSTTGYYGAQLRNTDFEAWDNLGAKEEEPTGWNSFMNAGGSQTSGIGANYVKVQKVKSSNDLRPNSTGKTSASFWSTSAFGIIANGNLTTGCIMANSMTADDPSNHNQTLTNDNAFSAPFSGKPDSLTVWVRFVPKTAGDMARVAATIHDKYDYRDPSYEKDKPHAFSKAELDYPAAEGNAWQRLSVPFVETGNAVNPEYMLVSFTTNKTPGKGSDGDNVYVDDMLMVYNPTVSIEKTDKSKYVLGDPITVSYKLEGTMSPYNIAAEPNVVYLELSDAAGSFEQAQRIAQLTTDYSGELTAQLSDDMELSDNYQVRVVTTNYPMISAPSEPFAVRRMPAAPVAKDATEITAASFVANWDIVEGATGYQITVAGKDYTADGGNTTSLEIKGLTPETEYSYVVRTLADDLISPASNEITFKTASGGSIGVSGNTSFITNTGMEAAEALAIEAVGLISDISISLLDNESGYFAIDTETLTTDGGTLTVTYRPEAIGTHAARLLLRSSFVDNVVVELSGTCRPAAVLALEATDVTPVSFTAQWEASEEAGYYLLSIFDADKAPVAGYDNLKTEATSIAVTDATPGASYSYSVTASANGILSEVSNETIVTLPARPVISVNGNIETALIDLGEEAIFTLPVEAADLFDENITVELRALNGSADFAASAATIGANETLTVTYHPTEAGEDTVSVAFNTPYADEVSVMLAGIARPLPVVALDASETAYDAFTANWQADATADAYLLTVKDSRDRTVSDYDRKNVGKATSCKVEGLKRLQNYTYYVEVMTNRVASLPSNAITARTVPASSGLEQAGNADVTLYPNPAANVLFVTGLPADSEYAIIDPKGMVMMSGKTQGYRINLELLPAGIYLLKISDINLPFIKE